MNQNRHGLKILSLNDAQAECLCGGWSYSKSGPALRSEVVDEFSKHAKETCGRAAPRTAHECLPGEPVDNGVKSEPEPWSKHIQNREELRWMIGCEVEVIAIYGSVRRFVVGLDFEGNLTEINGDEWKWCESEYAKITIISPEGERRKI